MERADHHMLMRFSERMRLTQVACPRVVRRRTGSARLGVAMLPSDQQ